MTPVRVAHVVSHPIQYFAPLYRELARRPEIDLSVYFYSDASARAYFDPGFARTVAWEPDLLDGYRWEIRRSARGRSISGQGLRPHLDVVAAVARGKYDVVWIHGYSHLATWLVAAVAHATGARLLVREEQTLLHDRPLYKRVAKSVFLRTLLARASGLYIGENNRRYFSRYGVPQRRLFFTPYCVDNERLQRSAAMLRSRRSELRSALGVAGDEPVILFCGKLVEKKRPLVLLEAFRRVRAQTPCRLLIVGDGDLRESIERTIAQDAIPDVVLAGFRAQSELPDAYMAADIFALLSGMHETWGIVVNEAMNFGLPLLLSDKVGSALDLVREGWNGFVVPSDDPDAAAAALLRLVVDADLRRSFGVRSRTSVERYSIEACANGVVAACLGDATPAALALEGIAA
jgi:glycosyltransferase involved in cell wall biosynthesis